MVILCKFRISGTMVHPLIMDDTCHPLFPGFLPRPWADWSVVPAAAAALCDLWWGWGWGCGCLSWFDQSDWQTHGFAGQHMLVQRVQHIQDNKLIDYCLSQIGRSNKSEVLRRLWNFTKTSHHASKSWLEESSQWSLSNRNGDGKHRERTMIEPTHS